MSHKNWHVIVPDGDCWISPNQEARLAQLDAALANTSIGCESAIVSEPRAFNWKKNRVYSIKIKATATPEKIIELLRTKLPNAIITCKVTGIDGINEVRASFEQGSYLH